jgi:hypothetical protein
MSEYTYLSAYAHSRLQDAEMNKLSSLFFSHEKYFGDVLKVLEKNSVIEDENMKKDIELLWNISSLVKLTISSSNVWSFIQNTFSFL